MSVPINAAPEVLRRAHVNVRDPEALERLAEALGPGPFALVILFLSPDAALAGLADRVAAAFGTSPVVGCTTAGEISPDGYSEGGIVALGLPASHFAAETMLVPDLQSIDGHALIGDTIRTRQRLSRACPDWENEFAFLMVDGLSVREDELAATLASGLGPVPLFGGSAGDGTRFAATYVLHGGKLAQNIASLSVIRTRCPIRVFSLDHLRPSEERMVVTEADPARRLVRQINAEPAAQEYARLLGKDPGQLTTFTFAAHPLVVRIGGRHHVRAIQRVAPNGDLVFFSAIDEGMVLTLADALNMASHLEGELGQLGADTAPAAILACDCVLRRIEAEEKQMFGQISDILRRHHVTGFSTYGEQLGSVHVNQTMTGVAIYPPKDG
jgi:hypothetical protein